MDIRKKYDDIGKKKTTLPSLANAIEKSWGVGPYNIGNINGSRSTITPTPSIAGAVSGAAPRNYSTTGPTAAVTGAITGAIPRTPSGLSPDAVLAGAIRGGAGIAFLPTDTGRGGASSGGSYGSNQQVTLPASIDELPTYNSEYMDTLNELAKQLISMNYDDWTKGSQYQALADRYGNTGRMSMQDVLGQVASRTGGLASSYATTAAQQQYNQYMAQLEEVARQMYSQDRSDLLDNANLYRNLANDEYDRYRDSLADYNAQKAAAQAAARSSAQTKANSADYQFDFTAGTGPRIENSGNKVKATGSGVASFSDIQRTISGRLYAGDAEGAAQLVESVWDDLSSKQKQDIKKMGFNVSD
jgi:hypothetical protein